MSLIFFAEETAPYYRHRWPKTSSDYGQRWIVLNPYLEIALENLGMSHDDFDCLVQTQVIHDATDIWFYGHTADPPRLDSCTIDRSDLFCRCPVSWYWLSNHECNDRERFGDSESFFHTVRWVETQHILVLQGVSERYTDVAQQSSL